MSNKSLIDAFCEEGLEVIDSLRGSFLSIKNNSNDLGAYRNCYVRFHTIKGNSGFLSYQELKRITQKCEEIFEDCTEGQRRLTSEQVDIISKVTDNIHRFICTLKESGEAISLPDDDNFNQLNF